MKLIYIEWTDACGYGGWLTEANALDFLANADYLVRQVGWVIEETDEYIALAAGTKAEDDYLKASYFDVVKIPRAWIRRRVNLTKHVQERVR